MKRTTVFLPEPLHEELRQAAFRARMSMAELIRERLQQPPDRPRRQRKDPLLSVAGLCDLPPFSEGIDDALYGE
jgi:hypothetical protein